MGVLELIGKNDMESTGRELSTWGRDMGEESTGTDDPTPSAFRVVVMGPDPSRLHSSEPTHLESNEKKKCCHIIYGGTVVESHNGHIQMYYNLIQLSRWKFY